MVRHFTGRLTMIVVWCVALVAAGGAGYFPARAENPPAPGVITGRARPVYQPDATGKPALKTTRLHSGDTVAADRIIVGWKPNTSQMQRVQTHNVVRSQAKTIVGTEQLASDVEYVALAPGADLDAVLATYRGDPHVRYAEADGIMQLADAPNDPDLSNQYALAKIDAHTAWSATHGSTSVRIAILDCGIYEAGSTTRGPGHEDLNGRVVDRVDFTSLNSPNPDDICNHGTGVAGIAAAGTDNGVGIAGVAWNASLLNVKVSDDNRATLDSATASGIRWAANHGAKVINMSFYRIAAACPQIVQDAVNYAWGQNVVLVAAAGNDATNAAAIPAACTHVVGVGATDQDDNPASFSDFGFANAKVAAPGVGILSTGAYAGCTPRDAGGGGGAPGSFYNYECTGTSFATPQVAAVAALLLSQPRGMGAQAVVDRIEQTADNTPGTGVSWQYGRLNAGRALGPVALVAPARTAAATQAASPMPAPPRRSDGGLGNKNVMLSPTSVPTPDAPTPSPTSLPTSLPPAAATPQVVPPRR